MSCFEIEKYFYRNKHLGWESQTLKMRVYLNMEMMNLLFLGITGIHNLAQ